MKTQPIGNSDLVSSRLSYGCMRITGTWNPREVTKEREEAGIAACIAAYEAGYTLFDHADIYAAGESERVFGLLLKRMPAMRGKIIIATKCGIRFGGDPTPTSPHRYDFSAEHILASCDKSLKRLGTDMIDIYQLHRPDPLMNPAEVAAAFETLHKAGKVRYFGVSNFMPSFVSCLQAYLPAPLVVNQVEIHLGRLEPFTDGTLDQCIEKRMTPLSWSPVAGGWLAEGGTVRDGDPRHHLLSVLDATAKEHGVSRTAISLAWLLKHPSGIIPIVGSTQPDRIRDAAKADDVELTRDQWYRILVAARQKPLP